MQSDCEKLTSHLNDINSLFFDFKKQISAKKPTDAIIIKEKIQTIFQEIKSIEKLSWLFEPILFTGRTPDELIALWFAQTYKRKMPGAVFINLDQGLIRSVGDIKQEIIDKFSNRPVFVYGMREDIGRYGPSVKGLVELSNVEYLDFRKVILKSDEVLNQYRAIRKRIISGGN